MTTYANFYGSLNFPSFLVLATTGSKLSSTLQSMHQKKENVGAFGRITLWHLQSFQDFVLPKSFLIRSDVASIDHLLIIAHEIFEHNPEFRFKKHRVDTESNSNIGKFVQYLVQSIKFSLMYCYFF